MRRLLSILAILILAATAQAQDLPKLTKVIHDTLEKTGYTYRQVEGGKIYYSAPRAVAILSVDYQLLPTGGGVLFYDGADTKQVEAGLAVIYAGIQLRLGKTAALEPHLWKSKIRNISDAILANLRHQNQTSFRFDDLNVVARKDRSKDKGESILIMFIIP